MRLKKLSTFFAVPVIALSVLAWSNARKIVVVTMGPVGATVHEQVEEHNLTVRSLERGKTEYWVRALNRRTYDVVLTEEQIASILEETTVMADASSGSTEMKVSITVKEEERRRGTGQSRGGDSGW